MTALFYQCTGSHRTNNGFWLILFKQSRKSIPHPLTWLSRLFWTTYNISSKHSILHNLYSNGCLNFQYSVTNIYVSVRSYHICDTDATKFSKVLVAFCFHSKYGRQCKSSVPLWLLGVSTCKCGKQYVVIRELDHMSVVKLHEILSFI